MDEIETKLNELHEAIYKRYGASGFDLVLPRLLFTKYVGELEMKYGHVHSGATQGIFDVRLTTSFGVINIKEGR